MDRGYHRHTLKFWCCKDWRCGWFRRPWRRWFYFERNLRDPCQFVSTISNPPRCKEKRLFFVAVQRPGDAIIIPHMFVHTVLTIDIGVPSVLVGWECITPADLSIPLKIFPQSSLWSSKSAVEEAIFGAWDGTAKELGDESSRRQRLTQAFWLVRGVLRPIPDACRTPVKRIPRKEQMFAQKNKKVSKQSKLPLDVSSPSSPWIISPFWTLFSIILLFLPSKFCPYQRFINFLDSNSHWWINFSAVRHFFLWETRHFWKGVKTRAQK